MQSIHNAVIPHLDHSYDDQKVEVSIESAEGEERVVLRYLTWTDGLGWCSQKTIRLDTDQLDQLQRTLTVARHRIKRKHAGSKAAAAPGNVIQLPTLA